MQNFKIRLTHRKIFQLQLWTLLARCLLAPEVQVVCVLLNAPLRLDSHLKLDVHHDDSRHKRAATFNPLSPILLDTKIAV